MAEKEHFEALQRDSATFFTPLQASRAPFSSTEFRESPHEVEIEVNLRDYLDVLLRRKWLIGSILFAVFVTTAIITLAMTPIYKATGRLEFTLQSPKVTKFEDMAVPQTQTREFMNTQSKLLISDSLAWRVIETLDLVNNPSFNTDIETENDSGLMSGIGSLLKRLVGHSSEVDPSELERREAEVQQRLLKSFMKSLEVKAERDTTILNLAFSSEDPAVARDVVNTLIRSFIFWQMDKKVQAASLANEQLGKQIELARIRLEKSEAELNRFAQKAGIVSLDSRMNLIYKQLEAINTALAEAHAVRLSKEALNMQAGEAGISGMPMVIANQLIQHLRQHHVELVSEYEDLLVVFKPDYPEAKRLKAKIDDVAAKIADEEDRILQAIRNDYLAAVKNEDGLRVQAEKAKAQAMDLNDRATQYNILNREVTANKDIHQSLLQRAKEIDATMGADISNIQVVDNALLPVIADRPRIKLNLFLSMGIGLMLGLAAAFLLEFMDNTIKRVDELSDRFGITILGVLPEVEDGLKDKLDDLVVCDPRAGFSEAIRTTRVSIQLSTAGAGSTQKLLITSTTEGEGKSTIAVNMAKAFTAAGEKVLIIDADLRRPRLHKVFSQAVPGGGGLSELLVETKSLEDVLRTTDLKNLYFIPAGLLPPNPAELLASKRMQQCLEELGKTFDRIIIDGPPSVGFADVLVLSSLVNGVILISTLGKTHRQALQLFRSSLANINARFLGSIVNRLNVQSRFGGFYSKYYYQSYGYENRSPERGTEASLEGLKSSATS
jgi:capsular exopolysaccharide synthesis family protein